MTASEPLDVPTAGLAVPVRARLQPALAVAFVASGGAALMLEVVWSRRMHLVFGGSAVATSAVLAAYMGGLALGSLYVADVVRKRLHPALAYAVMELVVAAYAFVVEPLLGFVGPLADVLPAGLAGSEMGGAAVRFVLAGAVLIIPTTLMGATLPCLADFVERGHGDGTQQVGMLYALNTVGAVLGTLGATFLAFPAFGVSGTNAFAAGLDVVAALIALGLWWSRGKPGPLPAVVAADAGASPPSTRVHPALWAWGFSGAVAMALEVIWSRALSMVVGSSIHAFSLMLAAFLCGLALGARLASGADVRRENAVQKLAVVLALTAGASLLGTMLIDRMPEIIYVAARQKGGGPLRMWIAGWICSALVMLPAATGFGAVMPLALRAAAGGRMPMGALVGRAYAINTAGAILGATVSAFVLVPLLGLDTAAHALCVLLAGAAAWLVAGSVPRLSTAIIVVSALSSAWGGWDVARWSVGAFRVYLSRTVWRDGLPDASVIFRRDGLNTTVTVEEFDGRVSLKVNGKTDASSEGDMPTQVLSGAWPLLLHEDPHRAAIIGFGSGVTSDALLAWPGITHLDMVELEPAVVEAGEFFAAVNHRPWEDPRYHGVFDDGRHFLQRPGEPYDIIVSEPSNPWITGASSLFTREFWTVARGRLGPGGIFLQWVQLYEMSEERIRSLMATFRSVFPHVLVMAAHPDSNDTFLIGSDRPITVDEALVAQRMRDPAMKRQLNRAEILEPLDVAALGLMHQADLDAWVAGATLNTDDNMYVELNAPGDLVLFAAREPELPFLKPLQGRRLELVRKVVKPAPREDPRDLLVDLAHVMLRGALFHDARRIATELVGEGEPWESRAHRVLEAMDIIEEDDDMPVVTEEGVVSGDARYARVVEAMVEGDDRKALDMALAFPGLERTSPDHRLLIAYLLYRAELRYRAEEMVIPLLFDRAWLAAHPEGLYYASRILWLADRNQWAARLALQLVDQRRAARTAQP